MTGKHSLIRRMQLVFAALLMLPVAATAAPRHWQPVGPEGGELGGIVFDPAAPATVYAITHTDVVFRSFDGGLSWVQACRGIGPVHDLAVVPAGAAPSLLLASTDAGILRSADGGATWVPSSNGLPRRSDYLGAGLVVGAGPSPAVYTVVVFPSGLGNPNPFAMFRSDDGGASWQLADAAFGNFFLQALAVDPAVPGRVYAGGSGSSQIWRTSDGGASWGPVGNLTLAQDEQLKGIAIAPAASPGLPEVVFVTAQHVATRGMPSSLYRSSDGGASWQVRRLPSPADFVVADPSSPGTLYALGGGVLLKSGDSGASWVESDSGIPGPSIAFLTVLPGSQPTLLAGYSASRTSLLAGLVRSTDGAASWQSSQRGLRATEIQQVAADPRRPGTLYAVGDAGLYKTRDGGVTWRFQKVGNFGTMLLDASRPERIYASLKGHLSRSDDGGVTWVAIDQGLPRGSAVIYALDAKGKTLWAFAEPGLFKSADAGATWTLTGRVSVATTVQFLAVDPAGNVYLVAQDHPSDLPSAVVLRSADGGATFTPGGRGIPADAEVSQLSIDPAGSVLYLASSQGVLRSADQGATWALSPLPPTAFFGPSRPTSALTVLADPRAPGAVYAGTYFGGVDQSGDGGATWAPLGGPTELAVTGLALDPFSPATVYAAANQAGLLRYRP